MTSAAVQGAGGVQRALEETEWFTIPDKRAPFDPAFFVMRKAEDGSPLFPCPAPGCGRQYQSKGKVAEHLKHRHSPQGVPRYRCLQPGCTMSYCRMDALRAHHRMDGHKGMSVVYEEVPEESICEAKMEECGSRCVALPPDEKGIIRYKCLVETCLKIYSTKYRCVAHILGAHVSNTLKPFICPSSECQRAYSTRDSLNRHKRITGHIGTAVGAKCDNPDYEFPVNTVVDQGEAKDLKRRCGYEETEKFQQAVRELGELIDEL